VRPGEGEKNHSFFPEVAGEQGEESSTHFSASLTSGRQQRTSYFAEYFKLFLGPGSCWADLYIKWAHSPETAFRDLFQTVIPILAFQISSS